MNDPKQPDDAGSGKNLSDTSVFDRRAMEDRQRKTMNAELAASPEELAASPEENAPPPTKPAPEPPASPSSHLHARAAGPPKPTLKRVVPAAPESGPRVVGPDDAVPGTNTSIVRLQLPRPPKSRPPAGPTKSPPDKPTPSVTDDSTPQANDKPEKPIDTSTRYLIKTLKNLPKPPGK